MGIRHRFVIALLLTAVALPGNVANAAYERGAAEADFVGMINQYREAQGLQPLQVDAELTEQSRSWAEDMAADRRLSHAPDLSVGISSRWLVLGENVGVHGLVDLERLFIAFVESPGHLANLVDPRFDRVGVGVAYDDDGAIWTTHRFMSTGPERTPQRRAVAAASGISVR